MGSPLMARAPLVNDSGRSCRGEMLKENMIPSGSRIVGRPGSTFKQDDTISNDFNDLMLAMKPPQLAFDHRDLHDTHNPRRDLKALPLSPFHMSRDAWKKGGLYSAVCKRNGIGSQAGRHA